MVPSDRFGCITAHSHPAAQYLKERVSAAWPSGQDYDSIAKKMVNPNENCVAHLVAAKEGIYVVTLSRAAIEEGSASLRKKLSLRAEKFQRDLPRARDKTCSVDEDAVGAYLDFVRTIDKPIFQVQLFPWPSSGSAVTVRALHPSCDRTACSTWLGECRLSDL